MQSNFWRLSDLGTPKLGRKRFYCLTTLCKYVECLASADCCFQSTRLTDALKALTDVFGRLPAQSESDSAHTDVQYSLPPLPPQSAVSVKQEIEPVTRKRSHSRSRGRHVLCRDIRLLSQLLSVDELESSSDEETSTVVKKAFVCDFPGCTRSFTRNSNLARHKRIHMGQKHRHTQKQNTHHTRTH